MTRSSGRFVFRLVSAFAIGSSTMTTATSAALGQISSPASVPQAMSAVPERIDPIIAPLPPPIAPIAAAGKARSAVGVGKPLVCKAGERLQRKSGLCQAIVAASASAALAKPASARPAAAKPATAKTATSKAVPGKAAKPGAKRG